MLIPVLLHLLEPPKDGCHRKTTEIVCSPTGERLLNVYFGMAPMAVTPPMQASKPERLPCLLKFGATSLLTGLTQWSGVVNREGAGQAHRQTMKPTLPHQLNSGAKR